MKLKYTLMILAIFISARFGCPIYNVFGVQCPACGVTRAWLSVFRGDIITAMKFHALFWLVPVPMLSFIVHDMPRFDKYRNALDAWGIVSAVILALYHMVRTFL